MRSLSDFASLKNDVFYRGYHILDYIEKHPDMSELDKSTIKATIMGALVYKGLINPEKDKLDLESKVIGDIENGYGYEESPFVQVIPLWLKEQMRTKALYITGGIPVSVFIAMPPGPRRCIYDMNTAISFFFDDFVLYNVDYNSPTREGEVAKNRPFLEVTIAGVDYLIDAITGRMYRSDMFKEKYGFVINSRVRKSEFNERQNEIYKEHTSEYIAYAMYLNLFQYMREQFKKCPNAQEHEYELEQSKLHFKDSWDAQDELTREMQEFKPYKSDTKLLAQLLKK